MTTQTMDRTEAEIQAARREYLGGSDAAAVVGLSRYRSPLDVWSEKTGALAQPDRSRALPIRLGHRMEQVVAELFCEETGHVVRRVTETQTHRTYPFLRAQIDRRIVGADEILECKTASGFKAAEWDGEDVPGEYIIQCLHQLMVTGKDRCHIACLIGGNQEFVHKIIERDDEMIAELEKKEVEFWEKYVLPRQMPAVAATDAPTLMGLFPLGIEDKAIVLPEDYDEKIARIKEIGTETAGLIADLKGEQEILKNEIRQMMGDATIATVGRWKATWKNQSTGVRLNLDRIKVEAPEVFEKYGEPGTTRMLRIADATPKAKKGGR